MKTDTNQNNLSVTDLITDKAIEIVFEGTNFGSRTPRELIAKDLYQVSRGQHVGYTMQCCLLELGLINHSRYNKYAITAIGEKYLEILNDNKKNQ